MCNLYHMAPRDHVERHFRTLLPEGYRELAVGPYNTSRRADPARRRGPPRPAP
jgi:hypothetical protein